MFCTKSESIPEETDRKIFREITFVCQNQLSSHQIILEQNPFQICFGVLNKPLHSEKKIKGAKENLPEKGAHS